LNRVPVTTDNACTGEDTANVEVSTARIPGYSVDGRRLSIVPSMTVYATEDKVAYEKEKLMAK